MITPVTMLQMIPTITSAFRRGECLSLFQMCGSRKQKLPKKVNYLDRRVLRFETGFNSSVNEFPSLWTTFQGDCSLTSMPSAGCSSDERL